MSNVADGQYIRDMKATLGDNNGNRSDIERVARPCQQWLVEYELNTENPVHLSAFQMPNMRQRG